MDPRRKPTFWTRFKPYFIGFSTALMANYCYNCDASARPSPGSGVPGYHASAISGEAGPYRNDSSRAGKVPDMRE